MRHRVMMTMMCVSNDRPVLCVSVDQSKDTALN